MRPRWLIEEEGPRPPLEPRAAQLLGALALAVSDRMLEAMGASSGLSMSALATLQWIGRAPGVRASYLIEALELSSQGVGHLVAQLEREGLVLREAERWDRRAAKLRLSELGARRLAQASRARAHALLTVVDRLPWVLLPRLTRAAELILGALVDEPTAALRVCRFCDWTLCRSDLAAPCPVALAEASHDGRRPARTPDVRPVHEERVTVDGAEPPIELWLEPGEVAFRLHAHRRLVVLCRGPDGGRMELERLADGHVALYAWEDATFTVLEADREVFVQHRAVPLDMGHGGSVRARLESLVGPFAGRRRIPPARWR